MKAVKLLEHGHLPFVGKFLSIAAIAGYPEEAGGVDISSAEGTIPPDEGVVGKEDDIAPSVDDFEGDEIGEAEGVIDAERIVEAIAVGGKGGGQECLTFEGSGVDDADEEGVESRTTEGILEGQEVGSRFFGRHNGVGDIGSTESGGWRPEVVFGALGAWGDKGLQ